MLLHAARTCVLFAGYLMWCLMCSSSVFRLLMESPRSEKDKNLLRETIPYHRPTRINRKREDDITWPLRRMGDSQPWQI